MPKKIKRICRTCQLYNPQKGTCSVVILAFGQKIKDMPVDPDDPCFYEQKFIDPVTGQESDFNEIKQIRAYIEDVNGKNVVKIEIPEDLEITRDASQPKESDDLLF